MRIQEQIKQDLKQAMKDKDEEKKNTLRIIIGEFGRAEAKELSDDEVIKIVRKLIKSEQESLAQSGKSASDSRYIQILESYLPQMASDEEIRRWIAENLDFSNYKNKMQAMRDIMAHFGASADGNQVKQILQSIGY
ncbi:MAG: GatB/YqeY domain-containing protein [Desulfobacterales bacterium]|nr:GatB/YqeY domain-containing protein [Desulfobacterales bacterium]